MSQVDFDDYEVVYSGRATRPRIDVDINGMKVVVPEGLDLDPEKLIEEKRDWIEKKKRKFEQMRSRIPSRKFEPGEKFPLLGEELQVRVRPVDTSRITGDSFELAEPRVEKRGLKEELENLYRRRARKFIETTVDDYAPELGVSHGTIRVKNQKTLWGSCSSKNNLNYNWRIIMAPPEIAEYVVVHELCHLCERNHSKKFWRLLGQHCDEPREKSRWLKEHSVELIFTEADL